jgi:hypothetical protein
MLAQWLRSLCRLLAVRGRPNREARKSKRPYYRLSGELLEDRVAPAVGATFVGGLLTVTLGAANDTATLTGTLAAGTTINVTGTGGFNTTYGPAATGASAVTAITVRDSGSNAGQSVTFNSVGSFSNTIKMTGNLTVTGIESITIDTFTTVQANQFSETGATSGVLLESSVTTTGIQSYNDAVGLEMAGVYTGTTITFGSTVESASFAGNGGLTITGNAVFDGIVGGNNELLSYLSVSGSTAINTTEIDTTGTQAYTGAVTLGNNTTLSEFPPDSGVTFGSTVNATMAGAQSLTVTGSPNTIFDGVIGGSQALSSLSVSGPTALNTRAVTTTGTQRYGGAVTLGNNSALTGSTVTLSSAVDATTTGAQGLTITGNASFGGIVGGGKALSALSVTGATAINTTEIDTTGTQAYTGGVTLGNSTTLTVSTASFASTVNAASPGAQGLSVTGNADFFGIVGGIQLSFLSVSGNTDLNCTAISTGGSQAYSGPVILTSTSTLTASTVNFNGTVNAQTAGVEGLTIINSVDFAGVVGGSAPLATIAVNGAATVNTSVISTTGPQVYSSGVTLDSTATLNCSTTTFSSTVNAQVAGAEGLTINGGAIFIGAFIGTGEALSFFTVTGVSTVNTGSTLAGTTVSFMNNLILGPTAGSATNTLTAMGTVNLSGTLTVTLAGGGGNQYGRIVSASGGVNLNGATLALNFSSFVPVVGDTFVIVDVTGQFTNVAPGPYRQNQVTFVATYTGGPNGNDFILTVVQSAASPHYVVAAAGPGGAPLVNVYNASNGNMIASFYAFAATFTGGVRVAVADVNGDGTPDIVCGAGPGGGPEVTVFDGKTFQRIMDFMALPARFTGGVWVAAGNITSQSFADIVVSADAGGGPEVTIFDGKSGAEVTAFYATAATFTGGIRIACADLSGDGFDDVIAAAGPGGGPQVTIFDGKALRLLTAFYALPANFTGGMYVAAGDVNGDGHADIIVGAEKGGGPEVNVFSGAGIPAGSGMPPSLYAFYALPTQFTGGVRVGYSSNFEGAASILTVAGPGGGPQVSIFDGLTQAELDTFYAFSPTFGGGVYVSGT